MKLIIQPLFGDKTGIIAIVLLSQILSATLVEGQSGKDSLLDDLLSRKERSTSSSRLIAASGDDYEVLAEFSWNEAKLKELSLSALGQLEKFIRHLYQKKDEASSEEEGQERSSRHMKRGVRFPNERRPRWSTQRLECTRVNGKKKCRVRKCGFQAPLDRISYNPNFGCRQSTLGRNPRK